MLTQKEFEQITTSLLMADCVDIVGRGRLISLSNTLFLVGLFAEEENDTAQAKGAPDHG